MAIWYLEISSWRGVSMGAIHWYGRLRPDLNYEDGHWIELERALSAKEVRAFNKAEGWACWHPGDLTKGFDSREDVTAAALMKFREIAADGDLLLCGNFASADPMEALAGPEDLVYALNSIHLAWEAIDGWQGGKRLLAQALSDRWDAALNLRQRKFIT